MKITSIICLFILFSAACLLSQEQRFIQINSADTIRLKPLSIYFQISETETYSYVGIGDTTKVKSYTIDEVDDILNRENFNNKERKYKYSFSQSLRSGESIVVSLNSVSELDRLYNTVKTLNGIEGKVLMTLYESPEAYHLTMYRKMYEKAKAEASEIAYLSGNSLGTLLAVSEIASMWDGYGEVFDEYKGYAAEWLNMKLDLAKQYIRRLQFKFEMK